MRSSIEEEEPAIPNLFPHARSAWEYAEKLAELEALNRMPPGVHSDSRARTSDC